MQTKNVIPLVPDYTGVHRMQHYYRDSVTAMTDHMRNMINHYGVEQVAVVIRDLITSGVFSADNKKD